MPTTIRDDFNPRHHCKGLPEEVQWFDCRASKHSLLPNEPSKWSGYPTSNDSSEDDENKQQSFNGWESVNKAKQTCHSVKESSPTICPSSCTKGFPKATVTQTAAHTLKERCHKMSTPIETNFWGKPPDGTFSYVFLNLSRSPFSPCLSTSLTCCHLKNQAYKEKNYVIRLTHRGWKHYYLFHFPSRKKRVSSMLSNRSFIFSSDLSPSQKNPGNHYHSLENAQEQMTYRIYSQPNKVILSDR